MAKEFSKIFQICKKFILIKWRKQKNIFRKDFKTFFYHSFWSISLSSIKFYQRIQRIFIFTGPFFKCGCFVIKWYYTGLYFNYWRWILRKTTSTDFGNQSKIFDDTNYGATRSKYFNKNFGNQSNYPAELYGLHWFKANEIFENGFFTSF